MDKRNTRIIAVIALITAIVGLSVGFAAFSTALNINSDQSTVTPEDTKFGVVFSSSDSSVATNSISGVVSNTSDMSATAASIDNGDYKNPIISNLSGTFTEPGQTITYTFYAHNTGQYDAYLKSITYNDVENESSPIICKAVDNGDDSATQDLVDAACGDFSMEVSVVGDGGSFTTEETETGLSGHVLEKGKYETITVTIKYDGDSDSTRADGEFTVDFGSIELNYGSVDN